MNMVVICCDTFRADIVGVGKNLSHVKTPHLDQLASDGLTFDRCFAEGLPTIPFRRCVFTGIPSFPWRFDTPNEGLQPAGFGWHPIPPDQDTLAERLHDAGFVTGLVSDTYHLFKPTQNFTRGFLSWRFIRGQEQDGYRSGPLSRIDLAAHVRDGDADIRKHAVIVQYLLNMLDRQEGEENYLAAQVFREASQWVEDNRSNKPFFLWIDSFSPHELWDPPKQYADAYFLDTSVKDYIHHNVLSIVEATDAEIERTKALYMGYVTFVDRWIGHLLETIDRLNLREDTVVMFTSDHGTQLMDRGRFGKGSNALFPFNTQINWIIRHPNGPRGQNSDIWTQNQDITSTILNMLGVAYEGMDGADSWAGAIGTREPARDYVTTGWGTNFNVRDDRYSVHMDVRTNSPDATVYDLSVDANEKNSLSDPPREVVAQALERARDVIGDFPNVFRAYKQRHAARAMRTFMSKYNRGT